MWASSCDFLLKEEKKKNSGSSTIFGNCSFSLSASNLSHEREIM